MHSSSDLSIRDFGIITVRHLFDFDALVREAVASDVTTHPCVVARNWSPRGSSVARGPSVRTVFSVGFPARVSANDVRAGLAAKKLRPCTPHEALNFAIDKRELLGEEYNVALGYVWHAPDGPGALNVWRSLGRPYVGTSPCEGTWGPDAWRFLATVMD